LLVGWDAADWKILHPLVDAGEMPALRRIVESGASGAVLCTQPPVPVAQWTTIATGKRPWQHQVCHPVESIAGPNEAVAVTAARRRSRALWEMLAQSGKLSLVVGWPATHGERTENVVIVSDRFAQPTAGPGIKPWPPPPPGTYWPEEVARRLDGLRMSPEAVQADVISLYLPDWKRIDQKRDPRLGQLRLFLATDFSHQGAMIGLLCSRKWDFAAVRFPALGAISQVFLPYCPPRLPWVPEPEFDIYRHVIRAACRMLDRLLQQLVRAAGKDAAVLVLSGHGVRRPTAPPPASGRGDNDAWKSPHGIFAACGPGFAQDALVFGATVLDVAPTVLTWFGLPIGEDMEGRVLLEGFAKAPEVARVPSWEADTAKVSPTAAEAPGGAPSSPAAARLQRESDWNLAQSYLDAGRCEAALPVLEQLFRAFPERVELCQALFQCQLALCKLAEASETLDVLLEAIPSGVWSLLLRAELRLAKGQSGEARRLVHQARDLHPSHPDAMRRLGLLLLRLREWTPLAELAREALKLDENEPLAWLGLAEAQLRQRLPAEAEEAALRAIGLNYYQPQAHFVLARALIAQSKWQAAREAMQTLLRLQPNNRAAATYAKRLGQPPGG
jgi:tetratricopeptide (TPR) repeat protein